MNRELAAAISQIALPKNVILALMNGFEKFKNDLLVRIANEKAVLEENLRNLKVRQERAIELMIEGVLSETDFKETKKKLVLETASVEQKIAEIESQSDDPFEPALTLLERLNKATVLETSIDEEEKFEFLKNVGSNLKIRDRTLEVTWEKPFGVAAEWKKRVLENDRKTVRKDTNLLLVTLLGYSSTESGS